MSDSGQNFDLSLLITPEEINNECRRCNADKDLADRCIEEAQMLDIKPAVGDSVYLRFYDVTDDAAQRLWLGGQYTDCGGTVRVFAGMRKALLYYAYGRIVRNSGGVVTRFDFVVKRDDYSDSATEQARAAAYDEAFAIADQYKADAVAFMHASGLFSSSPGKVVNNRIKLRKIGH